MWRLTLKPGGLNVANSMYRTYFSRPLNADTTRTSPSSSLLRTLGFCLRTVSDLQLRYHSHHIHTQQLEEIMPRYYCDYCDTYLTHDSPSVRKQHNAGYKHKANVRIYYQQYEAQQNQYLIDLKVKEHLGQAAAYQQVGAAYNQLRPRLPVLPNPMMPMSLMPGMRPPIAMPPRPMPGYPGMPQMLTPPGAPSMSGQLNPSVPGQVNNGVPRPMTMMAPGSSGAPTSGAPPMYAPNMYQGSQTAPLSGGFEPSSTNAQSQDADH